MQTSNKDIHNLTEGSILNRLLHVALPIIGTQIIQMTYNLTDMFWLGRLSSGAVAASGTVGMYMWLSMAFQIVGARGSEIGVSQNIGRGDTNSAAIFARTAVTLAAFIGVFVALLYSLAAAPLVGFFNIREADVSDMAKSYLSIIGLGIPFNFIAAACVGVFNGGGNSRTPFFASFIALAINIILDPFLIFSAGLGINGAAIATVIAQITAAFLTLFLLSKGYNRPFQRFRPFGALSVPHVKQLFKWTLPISLESFLFTFLTMFLSRMIAAWGADALAAQRVGSQIESLSWLIAGGFSIAFTAFTGQNFGANRPDRIRKGFRSASLLMLAYGTLISLFMFFFAAPAIRLFLPSNDNAVNIGAHFLRILAACQILACLEGIAAGAFRGIGKTLFPSVISISVNTLRLFAAMLLTQTPLGLNGIWISMSGGAALRGLLMFMRYILLLRRKLPQSAVPSEL